MTGQAGASALALEARLGRLIDATGPIPLATYMAECAAHYYASGDPLGAHGDFITAPEISQMFGEIIGLWCADLWLRGGKPDDFAYVELGPGRGTLAADAVHTMAQFGCVPAVHLVDNSPVLREMQRDRLPDAIFHDAIDTLPTDIPMLVIANEFFDALPVRQLVATHSGWRERVVARHQGRFISMPGVIAMDAAVPKTLGNQPPGSILELSPTRSAVMEAVSQQIAAQGGAMLVIDYGYNGPAVGDTFQAVHAHSFDDPFANPGSADLTAHVDFAGLADAARSAGVRVYGPVSQGNWLNQLGLQARADVLIAGSPDRADEIRGQAQRLTAADQMGRLFQVLAAAPPGWPLPEGFGPEGFEPEEFEPAITSAESTPNAG